jgi:two-component system, OmpR family, phosphate regulon sensor histidine kinase PhoR
MPPDGPPLNQQRIAIIATAVLIALGALGWVLGGSLVVALGLSLAGALGLWLMAALGRRGREELLQRLGALHARADEADREMERHRGEYATLVSLVQAAPEPVLATDAQGRISLCNDAAAALLGLDAQRVPGRPIAEVFTQEEVMRLHEEAARGRAVRREMRVTRAGGVRIWEIAAARVGGGTSAAVVMSFRDITEQARAMQVRSDFAANASHELRTPIAAMRVAMDTLQGLGEDEDPAVRAKFTAMLARNIERLEAMVRDLLDLSRLESPNLEVRTEHVSVEILETDLRPMFERVLRERNLTLGFEFPADLRELNTDRNLLLLILSNLIDNATKYAFEGTQIRVAGARAGGGGVRLEVVDRGIGIPLDQQQRIFERYYQVDSARSVGAARRGTGLGLSIVKHAIRRLGGTIRVESVWQQGTRMIVEIPAAAPGQSGGLESPNFDLV